MADLQIPGMTTPAATPAPPLLQLCNNMAMHLHTPGKLGRRTVSW